MNEELRKTGIGIIGDVPWGTHFCQFYRTAQDLLDVLVPYFVEGLENNEFCMWVTSEPLRADAARAAMERALPDFEAYARRGRIEIIPHTDWYLKGGRFDSDRVLGDWVAKLDRALAAGFDGLRLTGNTFWLEEKDWAAFTDYEAAVDGVIGRYRMLAVCTYSLDRCGSNEVLDVIRNHRFALIRRGGRWELVESSDRRRAEAELRRASQFPEQNPNPVLRLSIDGDVLYANPPGRAMLAVMRPEEDAPPPEALLSLAAEAARASEVVERELPDGRGRTYWFAAVRPKGEPYVNLYARDVTERKRAERELQTSEERYRTIVETAHEGIAVGAPDGRFLFVNRRFAEMLGYEPEDLLGKTSLDIMRPERRDEVASARHELADGGRFQAEYEFIRKDGTPLWTLTSASSIRDAEGRHVANLGMHTDITARKRAEKLSRESEERLARAQEIAHLGSWELDLPVGRLSWSDEVYRIFGLQPKEFGATYEAFLDAIHPDDRAAVDAAYSSSIHEGRDSYEIEHRIVRRDTGEVRVVHEKCEHRRDAAGRVIRSIGMVHDITERKATEALRQALAEQEKLRLGAAVEQASDGVVMIDLDGTIRYVNAAFEAVNRVARANALGRSYHEFLAGDPAAAAIKEAVVGGQPWHGSLIRPVPGGRPVELEVTVSRITDPSGAAVGGLITERDVTHENALQRQVRQAQKMEALGTLAGGITHDFNNILGSIVINAELALLDLGPAEPARKPLPLILQAADRGKELVKQIITFSRQREWERKPLEVAPVVKEGMKFLRATLPKDVAIHEAIEAGCGAVLGDPSHIHQILVNLCQNAALAMRESGGDLEVKLEATEVDAAMAFRHPDLKPGPYTRLTVSDSGSGMTPEIQERIFEPFFTTRAPGDGSGLGLAVVHGLIKAYGGAITVYSVPGKGSTFGVYIPRLTGPAAAADSGKPPRPIRGTERILLVEDETAQREGLARSLARLGYRVTARATGRSALAAFRGNPGAFDLVLTDQIMPGMTGLELAAAAVKLRPDIPVILCTGFSEKVNGGAVGKPGIRALLMKPFTLQELTRLIRKAIRTEAK